MDKSIRSVVENSREQFGIIPGRSTTDPLLDYNFLHEKYRDHQQQVHKLFIDLKKAFDRVPREELWFCMALSDIPEKYIRMLQDMYRNSTYYVYKVQQV